MCCFSGGLTGFTGSAPEPRTKLTECPICKDRLNVFLRGWKGSGELFLTLGVLVLSLEFTTRTWYRLDLLRTCGSILLEVGWTPRSRKDIRSNAKRKAPEGFAWVSCALELLFVPSLVRRTGPYQISTPSICRCYFVTLLFLLLWERKCWLSLVRTSRSTESQLGRLWWRRRSLCLILVALSCRSCSE